MLNFLCILSEILIWCCGQIMSTCESSGEKLRVTCALMLANAMVSHLPGNGRQCGKQWWWTWDTKEKPGGGGCSQGVGKSQWENLLHDQGSIKKSHTGVEILNPAGCVRSEHALQTEISLVLFLLERFSWVVSIEKSFSTLEIIKSCKKRHWNSAGSLGYWQRNI